MNVVIKTRKEKICPVDFRADKTRQNFKRAILLKNADIPAEVPLAALRQKINSCTAKSIYITEHVPQSDSLHWFAKRDLPTITQQPAVKRHIARQLAALLAGLHCNGLWHRDAKPSNILVRANEAGKYSLVLIDLDGIKSYNGLKTFSRRFSPFAHLAALLLVSPLIYKTDCLRTFNIYCNLTGVADAERKRLFRRLAGGLVPRRLKRLALARPEWNCR